MKKFFHLYPGPVHMRDHMEAFENSTLDQTSRVEFEEYDDLNLLGEDEGMLDKHRGKLKRIKGKRRSQLTYNPK